MRTRPPLFTGDVPNADLQNISSTPNTDRNYGSTNRI
jgi:hypothetical protein